MRPARPTCASARSLAASLALALAALPDPSARAAEEGCGFVEVRGGEFICGGRPFPVVGLNCYYLMTRAADPALRPQVTEVLDEARLLGATVVRTWAFNDGADEWKALQLSPGEYSEEVFRALDFVVAEAGKRGLKLLLPLVNNWEAYGGMKQYVEWSPEASAHDDFYTDPDCRRWYRDHARRVLGRLNTLTGTAYRDDPAIFGWELANEPRARARPASLRPWLAEMAVHLKSIDSRHLVSTGSEGFYGPSSASRNPVSWMSSEGVDFLADHALEGIDFASFHAYPDHWSLSRDAAVRWVRDHLGDAAALGKPVLLGEFGKRQPLAEREAFFGAVYTELLAALEGGRARAGTLFWILYADSYPDYDGFGVYYPRDTSIAGLLAEKHRQAGERLRQEPAFIRADADCDGRLALTDAVRGLEALFRPGPEPCCAAALDSNGDGAIDLSDPVAALLHLFLGRPAPPAPFPGCGRPAEPSSLPCAGNLFCP